MAKVGSLLDLEKELGIIVGPDLASSLVRVARRGRSVDLESQLLINDGLENLSTQQREEALHLLDSPTDRAHA